MGEGGVPGVPEDERFQAELEFVQCLANPSYLHHLAQTKVLEDAAFVRYLEYLLYWRQPEYAQYLIFPQAVFFLGLLQHRGFRDALVDPATIDWLHRQQYFDWLDSKAQELHRTLDAAGANGEGGGDGGEAER